MNQRPKTWDRKQASENNRSQRGGSGNIKKGSTTNGQRPKKGDGNNEASANKPEKVLGGKHVSKNRAKEGSRGKKKGLLPKKATAGAETKASQTKAQAKDGRYEKTGFSQTATTSEGGGEASPKKRGQPPKKEQRKNRGVSQKQYGGAEEASRKMPNAKNREIGKKRRQPKTQTWGGGRLHTKKKGPNAKEGKYEKNEASANKTTKEGAGTTASSFRCGPSRLLP